MGGCFTRKDANLTREEHAESVGFAPLRSRPASGVGGVSLIETCARWKRERVRVSPLCETVDEVRPRTTRGSVA